LYNLFYVFIDQLPYNNSNVQLTNPEHNSNDEVFEPVAEPNYNFVVVLDNFCKYPLLAIFYCYYFKNFQFNLLYILSYYMIEIIVSGEMT